MSYGVDTNLPPSDRYRIVGKIAAGGMAEIYLARMMSNAGVEREVVLKRLLPELQGDHEFVQMFHDEAAIAAQFNHPNIVQIHELGEIDGSMFIAMEFLHGVNLRDLLARLHSDKKRIPIELACRIMCGALDGLGYAHQFCDASGRHLNVVHRDVSPQNIIVTYEGTVKMVDFGVAKAEGKLHQTRAGLVKGKFAYMSPEQINGLPKLDGRSDLFAVAEVFYELLVHRHPFFRESDLDVLRAILDADPPNPNTLDPSFPPDLADILMKAMAKKSEDRFETCTAMQDAIERFLLNNGTPATSIKLGRYIRGLFDDRMAMEQRARETGDDQLLIEAMTVGRAERGAMEYDGPPPDAQVVVPEIVEDPVEPVTEAGPVGHSTPVASDPASQAPGGSLTNEIGALFGGEAGPGGLPSQAGAPPPPSPAALPPGPSQSYDAPVVPQPHYETPVEDAGEAPTVMGMLSAEDMAELQNAAQMLKEPQVVPHSAAPPPAVPSAAPPQPASAAPPPQVISHGTVPPVQSAPPPQPPAAPPPQPASETDTVIPSTPAAAPPPPKPVVTTRSETVVSSDGEAASGSRFGVVFFVIGLVALIGAIIFAVMATAPANDTMTLVLQSTPPGAAIHLDGFDIGAVTPQTIPNVKVDKAHTIELKLEGFVTHKQTIPASPDNAGEPFIVNWRFSQAPE